MKTNTRIVTLTLNPSLDKSSSVDKVIVDRKLRCKPPSFDSGGGGLNVSRALHKLGKKSEAYLMVGGPTGQMLQYFLASEGVQFNPIVIKNWTRENLTILEEESGEQFRFVMPGPRLLTSEWQMCLSKISKIKPRPDFLIGSGSLPANVPTDFYKRLIRSFRKTDTKIILDISGKALKQAVGAGVFLIKINLRELSDLVGRPLKQKNEYQQAAKDLIRKNACQILVVSLGAEGALMVTKNACKQWTAPSVPIKSRVGAGDSMVAGIVLGLSRGYSPEDAVLLGMAAGTAAVMTPGSELCRKKDAERLFKLLKKNNG